MPTPTRPPVWSVALIGNPNTGKSTLFTALVGVHQHVGNYPGVTVEKKTGQIDFGGRRYQVIDLPGLYSLAPRARDEMVAVDVLLARQSGAPPIDVVVCVLSASSLERGLYLVSQVLEFGLPTVVALNMLDVAADHGIAIDLELLRQRLPAPIVAIQANRRVGIELLKDALAEATRTERRGGESPFPEAFEAEVTRTGDELAGIASNAAGGSLPRALLRRLLLDGNGYLERALLPSGDDRSREALAAARRRLAEADCAVPAVETKVRYAWARRVLEGVVAQPSECRVTVTDRLDRVLTHRVWGLLVFAALMAVVFQAVFRWAEPLMGLIDAGTRLLGQWIEARMAEGALRSLLAEGVVGGVGGVLAFLPQILILFLFLAVLEDCGYMARAAYLMDKTMARVGLSGKSFIPMLSSFACAVPGIMATRVIEDERDRLTTILVAPLMTCSARLPVYALLIAAFVPNTTIVGGALTLQGLTLLALYLLGIVVAVGAALIFKKTLFRGPSPPFLLELPSYKWPSIRTIAGRVVQRGWVFLRCAGTLILTVSIVAWAGLYYPHDREKVEGPFRPQFERLDAQLDRLALDAPGRAEIEQEKARLRNAMLGEYQRQSFLGRLGRLVEPAVKPLGWDWRIGCAVIASLPAREIVVATMGVMYDLGEEVDVESEAGVTRLQAELRSATWDGTDRPVFNLPVALSILVFFALCCQCAATQAVIRRETNSWRWPAFAFSYMTVLAYLGALVTYQLGMWIAS